MADLTRLRNDLGYFAAAIGAPLTDWQLRALRLAQLVTVLLWARQMGKSRSLAVLALWWAYTRPGNRVFIISAGEGGAKRLLSEIRRLATSSPLLRGSVIDEQALLVTLSNGSEIRCAASSSSAIRGWSNDLLIVDEAGSPTADVVLSAALPTVTARKDARVVVADTAWAAEGPFYDFAINGLHGSPDVQTFRHVARAVNASDPDAVDAPWVTPTAVRVARETMGWRFDLEYLCEFAGASDLMFPRALLASCAAPIGVPDLARFRGNGRPLGGADWGARIDSSAVVGWGRYPLRALNAGLDRPVFGVALVEHWAPGVPLDDVVEDLVAAPVHWDALSLETNGIGEYVAQRVQKALSGRYVRPRPPAPLLPNRWERRRRGQQLPEEGVGSPPPGVTPRSVWMGPDGRTRWSVHSRQADDFDMRGRGGDPARIRVAMIATSAELKSQTYGRMRLLMERGQLVIGAETPLMRELLSLRMELRPGGGIGIEAQTGKHDDLADAAMLGLCPYRQSRAAAAYREKRAGQWRALLTDAAEQDIGDAVLPEHTFAGDVVETGDGLRVWREPVVQSVFGFETTCSTAGAPRGAPSPPEPEPVWLRTIAGRLFHVVPGTETHKALLTQGAVETEPALAAHERKDIA